MSSTLPPYFLNPLEALDGGREVVPLTDAGRARFVCEATGAIPLKVGEALYVPGPEWMRITPATAPLGNALSARRLGPGVKDANGNLLSDVPYWLSAVGGIMASSPRGEQFYSISTDPSKP